MVTSVLRQDCSPKTAQSHKFLAFTSIFCFLTYTCVFISDSAFYCFLLFDYVMQVLAGCFSAVRKLLSVVAVAMVVVV
jgi:hypothetical protein